MVLCSVLVALAVSIERAVGYFRILSTLFATVSLFSLVGMGRWIMSASLFPEDKIWNPTTKHWDPLGKTYFAWCTLAGIIMLSVYIMPMLLRPIDFLKNF